MVHTSVITTFTNFIKRCAGFCTHYKNYEEFCRIHELYEINGPIVFCNFHWSLAKDPRIGNLEMKAELSAAAA